MVVSFGKTHTQNRFCVFRRVAAPFSNFFRDNYKGVEFITEYVDFASSTPPYFATGPDRQASDFLHTNFDASNNICEFSLSAKVNIP